MRTMLMMILALVVATPAFAQDGDKPDTPKEDKPVEKPAEDKPEENGEKKREMTEEGKLLFADVERVYAKYYEILFDKIKANDDYKADDVWNEAVKEAKNAKYKDSNEFHEAILNMKRKDRMFKKKIQELVNKLAEEHAQAVEKWTKEQKK